MSSPPIGKTAMTGAERVRRYRLKHGVDKPPPKPGADHAAATIDALQKELAAAKAQIAELTNNEMLAVVAQVRFRDERRAAKPKVEKPPLPPDEERERIIKGLRTRVRNLVSELDATESTNNKIAMRKGYMPRTTRTAIDGCFNPIRGATRMRRHGTKRARGGTPGKTTATRSDAKPASRSSRSWPTAALGRHALDKTN